MKDTTWNWLRRIFLILTVVGTLAYLPITIFFIPGIYLPQFFIMTFSPLLTLAACIFIVWQDKRLAGRILVYASVIELVTWFITGLYAGYMSGGNLFNQLIIAYFKGIGTFVISRALLALITGLILLRNKESSTLSNGPAK